MNTMPAEAREGIGYLELELQMIVSHLMWVLGTECGSFGRSKSSQVLFRAEPSFHPPSF